MKKLLLLSVWITSFLLTKAQVTNDDCSTAIDLGQFPSQVFPICQNGFGGPWVIYYGYVDNLQGATPSTPYNYMSGCKGYDTVTTSYADDIWYKYGGNFSNETRVYLWGEDTVHLNFYYGSDCNNLTAAGCFTYIPSYNDTMFHVYAEKNSTIAVNYIQISSNVPGKQFGLVVCMAQPVATIHPAFGTVHVNDPNIVSNNLLKISDFKISPNSSTGAFNLQLNNLEKAFSVEIIDVTGKVIYKRYLPGSNGPHEISLPSNITNGIYNCVITCGEARVNKKLVLIRD